MVPRLPGSATALSATQHSPSSARAASSGSQRWRTTAPSPCGPSLRESDSNTAAPTSSTAPPAALWPSTSSRPKSLASSSGAATSCSTAAPSCTASPTRRMPSTKHRPLRSRSLRSRRGRIGVTDGLAVLVIVALWGIQDTPHPVLSARVAPGDELAHGLVVEGGAPAVDQVRGAGLHKLVELV